MSRYIAEVSVRPEAVKSDADSFDQSRSNKPEAALVWDRCLALHPDAGVWQTKSQLVFDLKERTLARRAYTVWNSFPGQELDFTWTPDSVALDSPGRIEGTGRLIWRPKGKPAYDRSSIYAEYTGEMKDGKANGKGVYFDESGVGYQGEWLEGQFEGSGRLQLANGDEYVGRFQAGKPHGECRYFGADGEIYFGEFRDGLRSGTATVSLPNGIAYQSEWQAGQEVPEARRTRFAQGGPHFAMATPDDVRIGVVVDRSPIRNGMLGYAGSNTVLGLLIRPADERLLDIWKGSGEIRLSDKDMDPNRGGVFNITESTNPRFQQFIWPAYGLPPLLMVLDVENRGSSSIQIVDAYLDVSESSTDLQPMVVIVPSPCSIPNFYPEFTIENFGWGFLEQTTLTFSFSGMKQLEGVSTQTWSIDLGSVHASATINVESKLQEAGVDIFQLRRLGDTSFSCQSKSQSDCFTEILRSGIFGSLTSTVYHLDYQLNINVVGHLEYKWTDGEGRLNTRLSPLNVPISLGVLVNEAECEGGHIQPLRTSEPLMLKLDRTRYKLPIDLRSSVAAGRVTRYSLPIRAPKSSSHNFHVVLVLADGREISSRPISLLYFFPNPWGRKDDQ